MKIAICDDNLNDAEIILNHCRACNLPYETVVFSAASKLLDSFSSDFYDLIFLDIEMKHPNGYEVGSKLARMEPKPMIIFTTNSNEYAIQGYGIAFRYLCKPVTLQAFRHAFMEAQPYLLPQKVALSVEGEQKSVSVNDILYFESQIHYVIFHLKDRQTLKVKDSMAHMLQDVQHPDFVHIHRSFCINLAHIDSIKKGFVRMTDGTEIPISRNKTDELMQRFMNRMRRKQP